MSEAEKKTEVEQLCERIAGLEARLATAEGRLTLMEARPVMLPYATPPGQLPPFWPWTISFGSQMKDVQNG